MLLAPVTAQPSQDSLPAAKSTKSSRQPQRSPLPKLCPTLSCFPPTQGLQPTSALACSPSAVTALSIPLPAHTSPSPPTALLSLLSPQAMCDTSSVQIFTHIFCPSLGASKSLISLNGFCLPKAVSAVAGSILSISELLQSPILIGTVIQA